MISRLIEKIKNKYWYIIILVIYISFFVGIGLVHNQGSKKAALVLGDTKIILNSKLKNERYISLEELILNFSNNVYYDRISRKLIITSNNDILKIKAQDKYAFSEGNQVWYDIYAISEYFGYKAIYDVRSNSIYIYNEEELPAVVSNSRTFVYTNEAEIIGVLDYNTRVNILLNNNVYLDNESMVTVKITTNDGHSYIGNIKKTNLLYEEQKQQGKTEEYKKVIMTSVKNSLSSNTDLNIVNTIAVEMLRINSERSIIEETYSLKNNLTQDIYGVITNGYSQASFDNSVLSNIVSSDIYKENISDKIIDFLNKNELKGLVIDFKNFKTSDKQLIEQYIKELSALLHKNNKKVMIKMNSLTSYNIDNIKDFVDYIVVQAHGTRTLASKISGSHSTVTYVKNMIDGFKSKVDKSKLILELAPYSILWTEKLGAIINSEMYSMNAATEYIKSNGIQTIFDDVSGQNMINNTKGNVVYKMWLEDSTSILAKVQFAKDIAGIAVYRSGYESKSIYNMLNLWEE